MKFDVIRDDNYESYAMQVYDNPQCSGIEEFQEDLEKRPKCIKRLLRRYHSSGELRELLILNHIVSFINVFGIDAGQRILFYKLEPELHETLMAFLVHLNYYKPNLIANDSYGTRINMRTLQERIDEKVTRRLEDI